ncbi:MAG: hydrolase [Roseburia sp.]
MRIISENAAAIVIDYQEKILPAMSDAESLVARSEILLKGLKVLEVPMILTTQYAKGLGNNIETITSAMGNDGTAYDKTTFSAYETEPVRQQLEKSGRKQVIICGIETHICVLQTAIDLKAAGYEPIIVADCVDSRKPLDKEYGLKRAMQEGVWLTTTEQLLFELTRKAGGPVFKQISALIR